MRQVYLGGSRDYLVEVPDGTQMRVVTSAAENIAQGRRSGSSAAGPLPRAGRMSRAFGHPRQKQRSMREETTMRKQILPTRSAARARPPSRPRACSPRRHAAAPAGERGHPATDRGRQEGRQGRLLHLGRPAGGGAGRARRSRRNIPGVAVRVERTGAERVFQRIGQEYASRIHAVDVVNSSDAAHFIVWKREGILAPYVPEDVAKHYPGRAQGPGRHVRQLPRLASASSATTPTW